MCELIEFEGLHCPSIHALVIDNVTLFAKIVMSRPRGVYISPSFSSTRPTCYLPVLAGGVAAAEEGVAKHSSGPRSVSQSKDT